MRRVLQFRLQSGAVKVPGGLLTLANFTKVRVLGAFTALTNRRIILLRVSTTKASDATTPRARLENESVDAV